MLDVVAAIDININPEIFSGGFSLTWHGLFTAVGIAAGVWLALRYTKRIGIPEDDGMAVALVAVLSGIVGARLLWVLEHTDQIGNVGDIFAVTDGGIPVYGAMIGGALGGFLYVTFFRKGFPVWMALDAAAPGMLLGQTVGRIGDVINGEHFAKASDLSWAFRYTHPNTDGPWAAIVDGQVPAVGTWSRGQIGQLGEGAVAVHPVAGGYEPILDLILFGSLLLLWRTGRVRHGWVFITYVVGYAVIRGTLALLRTDEQDVVASLSVPQLLAILTTAAAGWMAYYLWKHPQPRVGSVQTQAVEAREDAREEGRSRRAERGTSKGTGSGSTRTKIRQPGQRVRVRRGKPRKDSQDKP